MPAIRKRQKSLASRKRSGSHVRPKQNTESTSAFPKYPAFMHDALEDPKKQIRLLRILPAAMDDSPLEVELTTWTVDDAPPYSAISYAWGNLEETVLYCNNGILTVRSNCYYALTQVRRYQRSQGSVRNAYIWMDSICINQLDLHEKGHQVREMYYIYRNAVKVLACVGPEADGSGRIIETARESSRWMNLLVDPDNVLTSLGEDQISFLHQGLRLFSNRPYWTRLWIIQELHAASRTNGVDTDVDVLCGSVWAPLKAIHTVITLLHDANLHEDDRWHERTNGEDPKTSARFRYTPLETILYHTYLVNFKTIFTTFGDFHCFDPRDRIYGLLHLADMDPSFAESIPDYTISTWELAERAAPYLMFTDVPDLLRTLGIDCTHSKVQTLLVDRTNYQTTRVPDPPALQGNLPSEVEPGAGDHVVSSETPHAQYYGPESLDPAHSGAAFEVEYCYLILQGLHVKVDHITTLSDIPQASKIFHNMSCASSPLKRTSTFSLRRLNTLLSERPAKAVLAGSEPVALVCHETQPSDTLVVCKRDQYSPVLVLRESVPRKYSSELGKVDVVGQGFLIVDPADLMRPEMRQFLNFFFSEPDVEILPHEAMLFVGQDMIGKSDIDPRACLFRLLTKPVLGPVQRSIELWNMGDTEPDYDADTDPVPEGQAERLTDSDLSNWAGSSEHSCWSGCEWDYMNERMRHVRRRDGHEEELESDSRSGSEARLSERSW